MTDSQRLLAEYAQTGSESAFRELVSRYLNLVYSTALRLVGGDAHLAEDVAQIVFSDLAGKGRTLPPAVMLGGWLYQHTFHVATKAMRTERRRQAREREAMEMYQLHDDSASNWRSVAPILDEAITQLEDDDRTAILLRFFEQHNFRSVGEALGSNEDAARMRVNRALEKLQVLLKRRGVIMSATALGTGLTAEAVMAAPVGLAGTISNLALAGTAAGTGTTYSILKVMANTKLKLALATLMIVGATAALITQHQSQTSLRGENESLRQQITQLQAEQKSLSRVAAQSNPPAALPNDRFMELLRLRGEAGVFRAQANELARLRQENQDLLARLAAQADPSNQLSADDQVTLQQTHAVNAMNVLISAIDSYTTNHHGLYPESLDQLTAAGEIGNTNFAGNLRLDDFELMEKSTTNYQGDKIILSLRFPIPMPGRPVRVLVQGVIDDAGRWHTEILNENL